MRYPLPAFIFSILLPNNVHAQTQSVSGTWNGNYAWSINGMQPYNVQLDISLYNDSVISGTTHLYYGNNRYEHHKITGFYYAGRAAVSFTESLIGTNLAYIYEVTYKMKLYSDKDKLILRGKWKPANTSFYSPVHTVRFTKVKDSIAHLPAKHISTTDPLYQKLNRIPDVQKIIELSDPEKDSIKIDIYDNGEIDGDIISAFLDDTCIINQKEISAKPLSFTLTLKKTGFNHKIKLVAENLGAIPPNTALMIITTSKNRYELRLSSDLQKNALVEFFFTE